MQSRGMVSTCTAQHVKSSPTTALSLATSERNQHQQPYLSKLQYRAYVHWDNCRQGSKKCEGMEVAFPVAVISQGGMGF